MTKKIYIYSNLFAWTLVLLIAANYVLGWTTPTQDPPGGNVVLSSGALPSGEPGYIQFASSSTAFGGDAALFWDNTNKRLGIGTTAPWGKLHVEGDIRGYVLSSNRYPVGMESNILFNAPVRYSVSQSGSTSVTLSVLFDGTFGVTYSPDGVNPADPLVILVENLPNVHTQVGAWTGWSTRYWAPKYFKIEGYDVYNNYNAWRVIADYSSTSWANGDFMVKIPTGGSYTKLRLTIYEGTGSAGANGYPRVGLSNFFFLHPEAKRMYSGLLPSSMWEGTGGNVGIGTTGPNTKLEIKGGHGDTTFRMNSQTGQASPNDSAYLSLWASEPGWTYTGAGIGNNIAGSAYYGRISTARGASYIRLLDNAIYLNTINSAGTNTNNMYMSGGNVGIGTTTPGYKLDVTGDVRLTGNLIASANTLADCAWTAYTCDASQTCTSPKVVTGVERYTTGALCGTSPTQWYQMRLYCCNL